MSDSQHVLRGHPIATIAPATGGTSTGNTQAVKVKEQDGVRCVLSTFNIHTLSAQIGRFTNFQGLQQSEIASGTKITGMELVLVNSMGHASANISAKFSSNGTSDFTDGVNPFSPSSFVDKEANAADYRFTIPSSVWENLDITTYSFDSFYTQLFITGTSSGQSVSIDLVELRVFLGTKSPIHLKSGNMRVRSGNVLIKK